MTEVDLNRLLDRLRNLDEQPWIEFKVNNKDPEQVGKYFSALSNGASLRDQRFGYLVFGVQDETKAIVGTNQFFSHEKKGKEELIHWILQRLDPRPNVDVYDFVKDSKMISIVKIPRAQGKPSRFMKNAYIRIGSITRNLNDFPELEKEIWTNTDYTKFESFIANGNLTQDEVLEQLDFEAYFELMDLRVPKTSERVIDIFIKERLVLKELGGLSITNLGAILFARDLHDFDELFRKGIRLIIYNDRDRLETIREYPGRRGYAKAFVELIPFLKDRLPSQERIVGSLRKNFPIYPEIALRELIANALIHQDFSISGTGPLIEVFSDRIEITNPGTPLIDPIRFIDHNPTSRNEKLAYLMRRLSICEERGSGIDKVVAACELHQLPAPEFVVGPSYTRVNLFSPKTFREMSKDDKIRACYQHCCLKFVMGDSMTNSSLRERFNIEQKNYPMASRVISETIQVELIKDADPESKSKKHAKYIPFWA